VVTLQVLKLQVQEVIGVPEEIELVESVDWLRMFQQGAF